MERMHEWHVRKRRLLDLDYHLLSGVANATMGFEAPRRRRSCDRSWNLGTFHLWRVNSTLLGV